MNVYIVRMAGFLEGLPSKLTSWSLKETKSCVVTKE